MEPIVNNVIKQLRKEMYLLIREYRNGTMTILGYSENKGTLLKELIRNVCNDSKSDMNTTYSINQSIKAFEYNAHFSPLNIDIFEEELQQLIMLANSEGLLQIRVSTDIERFSWYQIRTVQRL